MYSNSALTESKLFLNLFGHMCCFLEIGEILSGEILSAGRFCPRGDFVRGEILSSYRQKVLFSKKPNLEKWWQPIDTFFLCLWLHFCAAATSCIEWERKNLVDDATKKRILKGRGKKRKKKRAKVEKTREMNVANKMIRKNKNKIEFNFEMWFGYLSHQLRGLELHVL